MRGSGWRRCALLAVVLWWTPLCARAQEMPGPFLLDAPGLRVLAPADLADRPPRFPFPVGERFEYLVSWFGVPAGKAVIEVARFVEVGGRRYAHVVATVRTNKVFSAIFEVDDRSEAWIDLDRFVTARTRAVEKHAGRRWDEEVNFDADTHFLRARIDKLHKQTRRDLIFDFGPFVYDTSDLVYLLRAVPLAPGYAVGVPTYANRKVFEFRIAVGAPKPMESSVLGPVSALAVHPSTQLDGHEYAAGEGIVWVAGPARIPIRLDGWIRTAQSSFLVQGLRAVLTRYVASAPGWSPPHDPIVEPITSMPVTLNGVPVWEPPAPVREARVTSGLTPHDTTQPIPTETRSP